MVRFITFLLLLIMPNCVLAQTIAETPASASAPKTSTAPQSNDNSLLQEQAAICASYARLMEYSGLLEKTQGELWRERRFFAGAMLRSTITNATNAEPSNADIDGIITEYSAWMIDLFTANAVQDGPDKLKDKDKLKITLHPSAQGFLTMLIKPSLKYALIFLLALKPKTPIAQRHHYCQKTRPTNCCRKILNCSKC